MSHPGGWRRRAAVGLLSVLLALVLLNLVIPVSETRWVQSLGIRGEILGGRWSSADFAPLVDSLSLEMTAVGFWEDRTEFGWALAVGVPNPRLEIVSGQSAAILHIVSVAREPATTSSLQGVRGEICVANVGEEDAPGLALAGAVQAGDRDGGFVSLPTASSPEEALDRLAPGQRACLPYEIAFEIEEGRAYQVLASLSLPSSSEADAEIIVLERGAAFARPAEASQVTHDAVAQLSYDSLCPPGFACSLPDPGPWGLEGNTQLEFEVEVANQEAECGVAHDHVGTISLLQIDSGRRQSLTLTQQLESGACPQPDEPAPSPTPEPDAP